MLFSHKLAYFNNPKSRPQYSFYYNANSLLFENIPQQPLHRDMNLQDHIIQRVARKVKFLKGVA